jgi:hypothetical protein
VAATLYRGCNSSTSVGTPLAEHDTTDAIPNTTLTIVAATPRQIFPAQQSMLQPSFKDHFSHRKVTERKWITKRRK